VARGLDDAALREHCARVRKVRVPGLRVLAGVEVDILRDGSLDLAPETLRGLDVVIGSVHTALELPREEMTRRVVRAVSSGLLDVLGHPTCRLIGQRDPVALDLPAVVRECAQRGVALEIDARPDRLDLPDVDVRLAKELGAKVVVSSDAHAAAELDFLRLGCDVARRGWLEPADVLNTLSIGALLEALRASRRRRGWAA
jgi:DNA polymerase (family 10)